MDNSLKKYCNFCHQRVSIGISRNNSDMILRIIQFFISIVLIVSVGAGQACAVLTASVLKPPCHKSKVLNHGGEPLSQEPCKVLPCRSGNGRVFISPDNSTLRIGRENKGKLKASGPYVYLETKGFSFYPLKSGIYLLNLSPVTSPQSFIVNCSLLC